MAAANRVLIDAIVASYIDCYVYFCRMAGHRRCDSPLSSPYRQETNMTVIDADAHVIESEETWSHLDPLFHPRRPVPVTFPEDTSLGFWNAAWLIDEQVRLFGATPTTGKLARQKAYSIPSQQLTPVSARIADMDRLGIDMQVIHPSFCLLTLCEDVELEGALMRSYNTFMARKCSEAPGRLYFDMLVPFRDPAAAVKEMRRVKSLGGAVSVFMRGLEWDKPISHPGYYPIYEEAQRLDLPIAVHLGSGSPGLRRVFDGVPRIPGEDPFFPPRAKRLVAQLVMQFAFYNLFETPLLRDFPSLRWAFLEAGGSEWLVHAATSLARSGKDNVRRVLEEGRIFVSCEPDEDLNYVTGKIGADCLVIGSDMPHFDESAHEGLVGEYSARSDLRAGLLDKLFWRNAARLYQLDIGSPA
jgi:predicted TIM-barrel fold metal-dependent hydrolase